MNIKQFNVGDAITRNEVCKLNVTSKLEDGSYLGERLVLCGVDEEAKIIFFSTKLLGVCDLSYARDPWDEGWCAYPEMMRNNIAPWNDQSIRWVCEDHPTKEQSHRLFFGFGRECYGAGMPDPKQH